MVPFSFAGDEFALLETRALYWPRERALLVADLHLEKASFFAGHGQFLPPYDSRATLEALAAAIRITDARRVICLGDSFHDNDGPARLDSYASGMLAALTRIADWLWITGNHDTGLTPAAGGEVVKELAVSGITLRHHARPGETAPELSGHFHPKLRIKLRGQRIVRHCMVASENRAILPAFGAFTGGMDAASPAIMAALQPARAINALLPAAGKLLRMPLWQQS